MVLPFADFIVESTNPVKWRMPTPDEIAQEYKIEYQIKSLKNRLKDPWPTVHDFQKSIENGHVLTVTRSIDSRIQNRTTGIKDKAGVISLIKGYASYPQYRNEKSIDRMYKGFEDGDTFCMPFVLKMPNGNLYIMAGNTRATVAMQFSNTYNALVIEVPHV